MFDLTTPLLAGAVAGAALLAHHQWRLHSLMGTFDVLGQRLEESETHMFAHDDPDESSRRPAPAFALPDSRGGTVSLVQLLAQGRPVMLVFTNPASPAGRTLLATIASWQEANDQALTIAVVATTNASRADLPSTLPGIAHILAQEPDAQVARAYGITLTPAVVLVRPNGILAGSPILGAQGIAKLLESLAASASQQRARRTGQPALQIGDPAPGIALPDLAGRDQPLIAPEQAQILLFWSPNCGYCAQLAPDLHEWEKAMPPGLPPLTLVTRGSHDEHRAEGFGFRTLLDQQLTASAAFGIPGTPAALIVDADGRIASHLARGIRGVRDLLGMDTDLPTPPLLAP